LLNSFASFHKFSQISKLLLSYFKHDTARQKDVGKKRKNPPTIIMIPKNPKGSKNFLWKRYLWCPKANLTNAKDLMSDLNIEFEDPQQPRGQLEEQTDEIRSCNNAFGKG